MIKQSQGSLYGGHVFTTIILSNFLLSNFGLHPKTAVTGTVTANNRISRVPHKRRSYMQPGLRLRIASQ